MSDDRTKNPTTESSEEPGTPGSEGPKAGYPLSGEDEPQSPQPPAAPDNKMGYGVSAS